MQRAARPNSALYIASGYALHTLSRSNGIAGLPTHSKCALRSLFRVTLTSAVEIQGSACGPQTGSLYCWQNRMYMVCMYYTNSSDDTNRVAIGLYPVASTARSFTTRPLISGSLGARPKHSMAYRLGCVVLTCAGGFLVAG